MKRSTYGIGIISLHYVCLLHFRMRVLSEGMGTRSIQSVMQGRVVTGQILDELGEPMIGVSVLVKGTTVGTITDFDGNYTFGCSCWEEYISDILYWL